jgi:hypothetical protein
MAKLTVQKITAAGLKPVYSAAAELGDTVDQSPGADVFLHVKNGAVAARTVTIEAKNTSKAVPNWGTLAAANIAVAIPAGEERMIGPFPFGPYSSELAITYSDEASVTLAAIRMTKG